MAVNMRDMNKKTTIIEGRKKSINIAQVSEATRIFLILLANNHTIQEVETLLNKYKKKNLSDYGYRPDGTEIGSA